MSGITNKLKEAIMKDFVSCQPMTAPSGLIFYLDFKYGSTIIDTFEIKTWKLYKMIEGSSVRNNILDKLLYILWNKDYTKDNLLWMNDIYKKHRRKQ